MLISRAPCCKANRTGSPAAQSQSDIACNCREGLLIVNVNGTDHVREGGSTGPEAPVCISPGVVHYYWNARNDTDLRIDVTLQPPGNSFDFFRTLIGAP
jgi:hypothetical protein